MQEFEGNGETYSLFNGSRSVPKIGGLFLEPDKESFDKAIEFVRSSTEMHEVRNITFLQEPMWRS